MKESTRLTAQIAEKRRSLRGEYGGSMTLTDLRRELRLSPVDAKAWGQDNQVGFLIGKRVKYDTDAVAKRLVELRGMC